MSEPFIAEIRMFAGNFAPRGWAFCNGQILSISQNTALFALIGTTYGGNGQTTFALPDLRGRTPIHAGQGPGLTPRTLGEAGGTEAVTLISSQIPAHNHSLLAVSTAATSGDPGQNLLAQSRGSVYAAGSPSATMNPAAIGIAGGSQPHNNMQPFLTVNYIIALEGIFPSRD
ncbi:phage tail protein [Anabaena azotica]|uniref:phage tail protein n=1 Tax=Anabaena azotica TaxID=197653 RepID=UPI0039A609D1